MKQIYYIGTAGWRLAPDINDELEPGSHLEKYSRIFNAVEINSSFYRQHRAATYQKWHATVSADFKFAVKLFRGITHENKLNSAAAVLDQTLPAIFELKEKLGCLLVQLPPSLEFETKIAKAFFIDLRKRCKLPVQLEPRHKSWGELKAVDLLKKYEIGFVLADPQPVVPKKVIQQNYFRLHGSPQMYRSLYPDKTLRLYSDKLRKLKSAWCIFDNSMYGNATRNALTLLKIVSGA